MKKEDMILTEVATADMRAAVKGRTVALRGRKEVAIDA